MSFKKSLLSAATVGLATGTSLAQASNTPAPQNSMAHVPKKGVICFGTNTCKGTGSCVVTKEQIEAANFAFKNQFKKSQPHECAGSNACSAKEGYLEWVKKATQKDCFAAGGFMIERKTDPKSKKETYTVKKS